MNNLFRKAAEPSCSHMEGSKCSFLTSFTKSNERHFCQYGSILIEMMILIGLIAALTPILYTHVAERKEEIDSINKANTMLTIRRETEKFLQDKTQSSVLDFSSGPIIMQPSQISSSMSSSLDERYRIALRKEANGSVNAIVVEIEGSGSDIKAARVARLIGVSAGIKSSMDSENAYGVDGLWKENLLSDYNLADVPEGSTVVTTEYVKDRQTFYTSDMFVDSDIDLQDHTFKANKIVVDRMCFNSEDEVSCRQSWEEISNEADSNWLLVKSCQEAMEKGDTESVYCTEAMLKGLLDGCSSVASVYRKAGMQAYSGYWYLGTSSLSRKVCYFDGGMVPTTAVQVISACNDSNNEMRKFACMYDWQTGSNYAGGTHEGKKYTASCQSIFDGGLSDGYTFPTGYYTLTSSYSETGFLGGRATPCVFAASKLANDAKEVVQQCNDSSTENHAACARAFIDGRNSSCEKIQDSGITTSDFYKITLSAAIDTTSYTKYDVTNTEQACYFSGGALADAQQTITACNSAKAGSVACGYGWQKGWNTSCSNILNISSSFASASNTVMYQLKGGYNNQVCNVTSCVNTADYCYYNQSGQNLKYCTGGICSNVCDDDSDCSAYGSLTPYCIGGTCKACGSGGDIVSTGLKCCSGYYRTASGACGVCGNYSADSNKNCYTECSEGTTHCKSGYYCNESVCVSDCGKTVTNSYTIGYLSNRNCCTNGLPVVEADVCYACKGSGQSACDDGYVCDNHSCVFDTSSICEADTDMENQTWINYWSTCTTCGSGKFQTYQSYYDTGSTCGYPTQVTGCLNLPTVGGSSYTPRSNSKAYGGGKYYSSKGPAYNQPIRHYQINISCNGTTENWRIIGPYVTWWEANEICSRVGKYMPSNRAVLLNENACGGTARWSLLKSASPSALSISSYATYVWLKEDYGNSCGSYVAGLNAGEGGYSPRSGAYYDTFAICGPNL